MPKASSAVTSGTGRGQHRLCLLMGRPYVGLSGPAHKSSWPAPITACQHCRAVTQHHKSGSGMWRRPVFLTVLSRAGGGARVRAYAGALAAFLELRDPISILFHNIPTARQKTKNMQSGSAAVDLDQNARAVRRHIRLYGVEADIHRAI